MVVRGVDGLGWRWYEVLGVEAEGGWVAIWLGEGDGRDVAVAVVCVVLGPVSGRAPVPASYWDGLASPTAPAGSLPPGRRHCNRATPPSCTKRLRLSQLCGALAPADLPSARTRSVAVCSGNFDPTVKVRRSAQQIAHLTAGAPMLASGSKSLRWTSTVTVRRLDMVSTRIGM